MTDPLPSSPLKLAGVEKTLAELSVPEMQEIIRALEPDADMHQGIKFLTKLLDKKSVSGVVAFVEKMHRILDEEGKLYEYDFSADEMALLKTCLPDLLNRRQALTNIGYGGGGAALVTLGLANISDNLTRTPEEKKLDRRSAFRKFLGDWVVPVFAEVGIGVALMNEVVKDWREMKLDHVANAVAELAERMEQEKLKRPKPASR